MEAQEVGAGVEVIRLRDQRLPGHSHDRLLLYPPFCYGYGWVSPESDLREKTTTKKKPDPDPTFKKKPDPDPTSKKKPGPDQDLTLKIKT